MSTSTCFYSLHSRNKDFELFVWKLPNLDLLVVPAWDGHENWVGPDLRHGGLCMLMAHGKGAKVEGIDGQRV